MSLKVSLYFDFEFEGFFFTLLFSFFTGCSFYENNSHPTEDERYELGQRLNMEAKQVKFWFQTKRNNVKVPKNTKMYICCCVFLILYTLLWTSALYIYIYL